jgi:hypothetical protein
LQDYVSPRARAAWVYTRAASLKNYGHLFFVFDVSGHLLVFRFFNHVLFESKEKPTARVLSKKEKYSGFTTTLRSRTVLGMHRL